MLVSFSHKYRNMTCTKVQIYSSYILCIESWSLVLREQHNRASRLLSFWAFPLTAKHSRPSYRRTSNVRISEITDETFWFRNFARQCIHVKYVRVPTQGSVLNYHLSTFTRRLVIFVYYVYALVLFMQ
jgi:hypothetical protein